LSSKKKKRAEIKLVSLTTPPQPPPPLQPPFSFLSISWSRLGRKIESVQAPQKATASTDNVRLVQRSREETQLQTHTNLPSAGCPEGRTGGPVSGSESLRLWEEGAPDLGLLDLERYLNFDILHPSGTVTVTVGFNKGPTTPRPFKVPDLELQSA
jgi:hypothetical protein